METENEVQGDLADIMKDMAARAKWRELIGKHIDGAQNVYQIYGMLTKSYRITRI